MLQKTLLNISILIVLISCMSSCDPFGEKGPEASFVDIPAISFSHPLEQGPRSHKIEHVEIFFENFSIGYYELPVNIAVIPTQETSTITIYPAIRLNGLKNNITAYEMMEPYMEVRSFVVGETYTISPTFKYLDNIIFDYVENFENSNSLNFDLDEIDSTQSVRVTSEAADGNYSCLMSETNGAVIEIATDFFFTDLINQGRSVFVEFDYKNDTNFEFGMTAYGNGNSLNLPYITLLPRDEWNKIYLDITQIFIQAPAESYKLYFSMLSRNSDDPSQVFLDNVKLLHIP